MSDGIAAKIVRIDEKIRRLEAELVPLRSEREALVRELALAEAEKLRASVAEAIGAPLAIIGQGEYARKIMP